MVETLQAANRLAAAKRTLGSGVGGGEEEDGSGVGRGNRVKDLLLSDEKETSITYLNKMRFLQI